MLSKLSIRQKLIVTITLPLLAIVGLAAFAYPTFETVKVNGPQYKKIRDAKDIEADILPPPAFAIEGYLDSRLIIDAKSPAEVERLAKELKRLQGEFLTRHRVWQKTLKSTDEIRSAMRDASEFGQQLFALANDELVPSMRTVYSSANDSDRDSALTDAKSLFEGELSSLYSAHKKAIDTSVELSNARQVALESETSALLRNRFTLLSLVAFGVFVALGVIGAAVSRSINRPIKALTDSANRTATVELPSVVERLQSGEADVELTPSRSSFSESNDELGQLARAFDSMHDTAVNLASNQASVRRNVSNNLVNIGRRNQGLLKRTLNLISQMEQDERDSGKLEQMFRLDHLTTRMRRNAESLLVLAGGEPPRMWAQATEIADVLRAALSQIEAYDRVDFGRLDPARVKGAAINDIAHMVAELVENATYFSPPTTRVTIHGKQRLDGYLVVVSDDGVGMSAADFERANSRIASPQDFDAEPSKVLGHVVVGRLAKRHGARVRLTESATAGVAAQILLPLSILDGPEVVEPSPDQSQSMQKPLTQSMPASMPAPTTPTPSAPTPTTPTFVAGERSDAVANVPRQDVNPAPQSGALPQRTSAQSPRASAAPQASANEVSNADLQPRVVPGAPKLVQRVRGAQMPDTGPMHAASSPATAQRSPDVLRGSLSALQRGSALGRNHASQRDSAPFGETPTQIQPTETPSHPSAETQP